MKIDTEDSQRSLPFFMERDTQNTNVYSVRASVFKA